MVVQITELLINGSQVLDLHVTHENLALPLFVHLHLKDAICKKKNYTLLAFLLITIALLIAVILTAV